MEIVRFYPTKEAAEEAQKYFFLYEKTEIREVYGIWELIFYV